MMLTIVSSISLSVFSQSAVKPVIQNPNTFCNPITLTAGSDRARRGGEPIVLIFKDDYYLFASQSRGYWYSNDFRDWTYVDVPTFPGGVLSVVIIDGKMFACSMNNFNVFTTADPKKGVWEQAGTFSSNRYGDANMFCDDDGRLYMYYGWSQILPIKVVEIDPKTFKEKGEPAVCFFGNHDNHGFERRRAGDVIFPYFDHREYRPEEYPWIEGPWMIKHNGKYYLMYAAIGLEFFSYSHGVYVSDSPMGPFVYSEHNPLTFKTTGISPGAGHGSIFRDKLGNFWTICMVPSFYGGGRGGTDISIFPTAVDAQGVMYGNTAFGDYPQYLPGTRKDPVNNNFTGWMLLSKDRPVETSSTLENFWPAYAVNEDPKTHWSAQTGNPGEYMTVDLGKVCDVYGIQIHWDRNGANVPLRMTAPGTTPPPSPDRYQSYTVEVSNDNQNWTLLIDKSNNKQDLRVDYIELPKVTKARYVKLTNKFTHDEGRFAVKALRVFGNPKDAKFTKVNNVTAIRSKLDRRDASLVWEPVDGADGYVVRYGIEPGKLYNNYMVYNAHHLNIYSLNVNPEYYFEVEAFSSGIERYKERTEATRGRGAEIELRKGPASFGRNSADIDRRMTYEGVNEYVFENITPDTYTFAHTFGPVLWSGELTEAQLIGSSKQPTVTALNLMELGRGTEVWGSIELRVYPGEKSGKIVVTFNYNKQ